jgi:hypothetical protein
MFVSYFCVTFTIVVGETLQIYAFFFKERYAFPKKSFKQFAKVRKKVRACNSTDKIGHVVRLTQGGIGAGHEVLGLRAFSHSPSTLHDRPIQLTTNRLP